MDAPFSTDELLQQTRWLHRLARGLVGDPALADDLVQDTMAQALARPPQLLRDLRAWLVTVLRRHAHKQARRQAARPEVERRAARSEATPAADAVVAQAMVHRDVVDAVLALAEPYRTAILLRYLHDLPIGDVAAQTGVPLATARSHVQRGLAQLRARLDHRYGNRAAWCAPLGATPSLATAPSLGAAIFLLMKAKPLASLFAAGCAVATALWCLWPEPAVPSLPLAAATAPTHPDAAVADVDAPRSNDPRTPAAAATAPGTATAPLAVASGVAIDEETQRPLAGVEVSWHYDGGDTPPPRAVVQTDAAGRFALPSERSNPHQGYEVLLRRDGYAWVVRPPGDPVGTGPQRYDLGAIPLPPGTGIAGRVVDRAGAPVADAALLYYDTLFYIAGGRAIELGSPLEVGRSRADGTFAAAGRLLPVQNGLIAAASPQGFGWVALPQLTRARSELRDLRIELAGAGELAVHVQDRAGAPVTGAMVVANPQFEPLGTASPWQPSLDRVPALAAVFTARTDARGDARLPALPCRELACRERGAGYLLRVACDGFLATDLAVDLAAGPQRVLLVLAPPRAITVSGTVADVGGRPLAGATVSIATREPSATTGPDGTFAATVFVRDPQLSATARAAGHRPQGIEQRLAPAVDRLELSFRLEPAADLAGVVVDENDHPVAGATVIAVGERATAQSDVQGRFVLADLPVGKSFDLDVEPPGDDSAWSFVPSATVTTADSPVTVRLRSQPEGECTLLAELVAADGSPLESRHQQLLRGGNDWHPSTATIGRITADHLAPGAWKLLVESVRGAPLGAEFTIAAGEREHHVTLRQSPPATVLGEIVGGADFAAPAQLSVTCAGDNGGHFVLADGRRTEGGTLVLTTANGLSFKLEDVDPTRPVRVDVEGDGWVGTASIDAKTDAPVHARVVLQRTGTIRFVADAPWPQHGLRLRVQRPGEPLGVANHFDGIEGRTELMRWPVAAGTWEWRIESLPGAAGAPTVWQGRVEVAAGGETTARVGEPARR